MRVGQSVWVYSAENVFQLATVEVPLSADEATVKTADGKSLTTSVIGQYEPGDEQQQGESRSTHPLRSPDPVIIY